MRRLGPVDSEYAVSRSLQEAEARLRFLGAPEIGSDVGRRVNPPPQRH